MISAGEDAADKLKNKFHVESEISFQNISLSPLYPTYPPFRINIYPNPIPTFIKVLSHSATRKRIRDENVVDKNQRRPSLTKEN